MKVDLVEGVKVDVRIYSMLVYIPDGVVLCSWILPYYTLIQYAL